MKKLTFALMGAAAMISAPAFAQSNNQGNNFAQQQQDSQLSTQQFVNEAAMTNMFEMQSGQLALDRARHPAVRRFAQRLMNDHQNAESNLEDAAGNLNFPNNLRGNFENDLQDLQSTRRNFDQQFLSMEISGHQDAIDLYQEYAQNGANAALRNYAQRTLPVLQRHLNIAQRIENNLNQGNNGQASNGGNNFFAQSSNSGNNFDNQGSDNDRVAGNSQNGEFGGRVVVQQHAPEVNVQQARPQIIVRQPPPLVTVQEQQPEIIVRMPKPAVNVATSNPQVSVQMPKPQVNVVQPQQQSDVNIDRAQQPHVTFQRTGQPRVVVKQAQGQPRVQYEQLNQNADNSGAATNQSAANPSDNATDQSDSQSATNPQASNATNPASSSANAASDASKNAASNTTAAATTATAGATKTASSTAATTAQTGRSSANADDAWVTKAEQQANDGSDNAPTGPASTRQLQVQKITDMNLFNAKGQNLGNIERVVLNRADGRRYIILANGGFLGLFQDEVAIPMERVHYENNKLVIRGMTKEDVENMPDWKNRIPNRQALSGNTMVSVASNG